MARVGVHEISEATDRDFVLIESKVRKIRTHGGHDGARAAVVVRAQATARRQAGATGARAGHTTADVARIALTAERAAAVGAGGVRVAIVGICLALVDVSADY